MTVSETLANYVNLPPDVQKHLKALEVYIGDTDGRDTVMWCTEPPNTCVDDGTIDAGEAVTAFNGIVAALTAALSDQVVVPKAVADIVAERQRQITKEGWTLEHDDEHEDGSLADAAACYAATTRAFKAEEFAGVGYKPYTAYSDLWPSSWADRFFRPKRDRRRRLVIAAALLVAEIERLDRAMIAAAPASTAGDVGK